MKRNTKAEVSDTTLYDLLEHYKNNKDEKTGIEILELLSEIIKKTFNYILQKSCTSPSYSDFILKKEAVSAVSSACWITVTNDSFLENFEHWKEKVSTKKEFSKYTDPDSLFTRYVSNLAARTIYRLSRNEFSEYYNLFGQKRTVHYLEDLKVQLSDSSLFKTPPLETPVFADNSKLSSDRDSEVHVLNDKNPFIMQAFNMIENPHYRSVLYKYDIKGLSLKQISIENGKDYDLIRQWHIRALKELKKNLDKILTGTWGKHYFLAVEIINKNYSQLEEPYILRLKLLEMNSKGCSITESFDRLVSDGTLPEPDTIKALTCTEPFDNFVQSLHKFPYMDHRLLDDEHFKENLNNELKNSKKKQDVIKYIFVQVLKFHLQQILWALFETFREITEIPPTKDTLLKYDKNNPSKTEKTLATAKVDCAE